MGAAVDDGYAILSDVLSHAECDSLIDALELAARGRAGTRHLMSHPCVQAVASDPRMLAIAGAGAMPFRATLFNKTSKANWLIPWHQDTALPLVHKLASPEWGPWSRKAGVWYAHAPEWALQQVIALRLHLDPSTAANGPLRVIPGTHHKLLTDQEVDAIAHDASAVDCLAPKGGVIAMRPLIIHASSKISNDLPRRVLHIEYALSLTPRPGVELAIT